MDTKFLANEKLIIIIISLDKKAACFALAGFLKGDNSQVVLLQCEIDCCTGSNCNTQVPTLSLNAVKVFEPAGKVDINLFCQSLKTSKKKT